MASASAKCKDHEYEICVWEYKREHYETLQVGILHKEGRAVV